MKQLFINTDNNVSFTVTDKGGAAVTGATVEITVKDANGDELAGQVWPSSCTEDGSTGVYNGIVQKAASIVEGAEYQVLVSVDGELDANASFWAIGAPYTLT